MFYADQTRGLRRTHRVNMGAGFSTHRPVSCFSRASASTADRAANWAERISDSGQPSTSAMLARMARRVSAVAGPGNSFWKAAVSVSYRDTSAVGP